MLATVKSIWVLQLLGYYLSSFNYIKPKLSLGLRAKKAHGLGLLPIGFIWQPLKPDLGFNFGLVSFFNFGAQICLLLWAIKFWARCAIFEPKCFKPNLNLLSMGQWLLGWACRN